jgi:hypothetical protein
VRSDGGSFTYLNMHVGADWDVLVNTYEDHAPILNFGAGNLGVMVCISERDTSKAVAFARALLRDVQVFAAEMERIYAEKTSDTNAAGEAA